jgi:uncharacterized protein YcfL
MILKHQQEEAMKVREKVSKSVVIAITLFIITSLCTPFSVTPVRADAPAANASSDPIKSAGPHGPEGQPLEEVAKLGMPAVDTEKLLEEAQQRSWDEPPRFATSLPVQINPTTAGTWETLENGLQMWRLRITSVDAISLNMGFTAYHMPPGGELYVYSPDYGQVLGPFTEADNEEHGQLWTPIVDGAEVVLEVSVPASEVSALQLELTSVNHGFTDFETAEKSGSCNVDVICTQGNSWRSQIRSVGRYTFSGSFLCSGALINNTAQNFRPFFLTANHCLNTPGEAASVVVYWNYDCPTCRVIGSVNNGTSISTAGFPTQSGAFLRATYAPSDMTLLELDENVATSVNAFWSGWDRSGANATSAVAIHHPQGHEKRISFENNATSITSYLGSAAPGNGTHIRITDWDLGTTEGGSSGSPLFNQNGRIIGQLHGGFAACGNNDSDWYGRLFTSWTGGGTNASRLSNWLDPGNTGAVVLNGLTAPPVVVDAFEPDNTSAQAKTINIGSTQTHSIVPVGDIDWVKFTLTTPSAVVLETSAGQAGGDTIMELYDSSLTLLRSNDDRNFPSNLYSYINTCDTTKLPAGTYYVKVYEFENNGQLSSYKLSLSAGNNCIYTRLAGALIGMLPLYPGSSARQSFAGIDTGPVQLENIDAAPMIAAERVIYKINGVNTSYSELMAMPDTQLDTSYWLPWYNNVALDTQLRIGNVSNSTATVRIYIGGTEVPDSPITLPAGASTRKSYPGVDSGPVEIVSNQVIVAAERVIYKVNNVNTSYSELLALPNGQLDTTYWLPWYDNVNADTQLRFANVSSSAATVQVFIGGQQMVGSPFNLPAGGSTRKSFAGINGGPVRIVSTQNLVAAERIIYKVNNANTSFSEMMALPNGQLNTTHWLPWYNNVDLSTELRIGNASNSAATVQVFIGGVQVAGSPFNVPANQSVQKTFAGINNGPVRIVGNQNITVSERMIYKVNNVNTSLSELMALPNSLLDVTYWLPWYNNVALDTQLRFGVP